jgi:zinc D-Ala-D-Ala carboxypeptidase
MLDWSKYPNFSESEFKCSHTGKCLMHPDFMARLQSLRKAYGKSMKITSGYRDPTHPIEAKKASPGAHSSGRAADVAIRGADALELVKLALAIGFTGIGVQQKGEGRFIHLDDIEDGSQPRPMIWSY